MVVVKQEAHLQQLAVVHLLLVATLLVVLVAHLLQVALQGPWGPVCRGP